MSNSWMAGHMGRMVDESVGRHTTAAICEKGHVVTTSVERYGPAVTKHCSQCGAPVISKCPSCSAPIHGHFVPPGVSGVGGALKRIPAYCHECGKPYPWTAEKIAAAQGLADDLEDLSAEDRAKLKTAIEAPPPAQKPRLAPRG